ncbi:ketoacyl-ACP synthase III family protein [Sphaerisporangium rubeum]|uniref:3-oxoacyl-[acyl-carrier-protein] synthase-3 n=1 Tax=Sphaerisporangium rubeum TaxID=321317 RepID=A0A7X0M5H4_9ACTN|nr:3-oxoacyl-[acyl-carrier-protein] synthase-3 [Sphaerisporangium rubeum]
MPDTVTVEQAARDGLYPADEIERFQQIGAAVAGDIPAPEMALRAVQDAYDRWGESSPRDLDLLLYPSVWHQGPNGWQPQHYLQMRLLGGDVPAYEIRSGCVGMISSLELAASYLQADPGRRTAMVVSADNHGTPLVDRWRMTPGAVIGDAACALLLGKEYGMAELLSVNATTIPEADAVNDGGYPLFPPDATVGIGLSFGDRHEEFRQRLLKKQGTGIHLKIQKTMMEQVERTLDEAGIKLADITRVAFPHGRREDLDGQMSWLGIGIDQTTWDYGRRVGHCGAVDQFIAFEHLIATGGLQPGDHYLMVGFGSGTSVAAAAFRVLAPAPVTRPAAREGHLA